MAKFTSVGGLFKALFVAALIGGAGLAVAAEVDSLSSSDAANVARFPENQAPSSLNDGARALEGIIARWNFDTNGSGISTGSANAYAFSATRTISAYATGQVFMFRANFTNTSTATLNISTLGAKQIFKAHDVGLASGDIEEGQVVQVVYDGTAFQLLSAAGNAGLAASNNLSDVASATVSRTNLGLGTAAVMNTGTANGTVPMISTSNVLLQSIIPAFTGASAGSDGSQGGVPIATSGQQGRFLRADGTWVSIGGVLQSMASATTGTATGTTNIPTDDTVPLSTEGTQFLSVSITPTSTSNRLKVTIQTNFAHSTSNLTCALYRDSENAVSAWRPNPNADGLMASYVYEYLTAVRSTSSQAWKVRCGPDSAATITLNGQSGSRVFGGTVESFIRVDEINY